MPSSPRETRAAAPPSRRGEESRRVSSSPSAAIPTHTASRASYERCVRLHLTPRIGGVRLHQLRPLHVEVLLAGLQKDGVSGVPKSRQSRRVVELPKFCVDALHDHRKRMLAEGHDVKAGPVFVTRTGNLSRSQT